MLDAARYFSVPLRAMTFQGAQSAILEPSDGPSLPPAGVTSQFLDDAAKYHSLYTAHGYFRTLLENARTSIGLPKIEAVLDLGSGSGNSVVPALDMFPDADVVAVDISPNLLQILWQYVSGQAAYRQRTALVCMDAARNVYAREVFDVVVGAAILHHLMSPDAAVAAALHALKPGGHAIFFEPFEAGNSILRLAYHQILQDPRARLIEPKVREFFERMSLDFAVRMDRQPDHPSFDQLDDKWMFSKSFFFELTRRLGAKDVTFFPLHGLERPFSQQTETNLRLGAQLTPGAVPRWAWDRLEQFDLLLSARAKEDMLIEACVVFTK